MMAAFQPHLPTTVYGTLVDLTKNENQPIIVTHSGRFHADDALAVGMLLQLPEFSNALVIRSRDPDVWNGGTVVVDVGGTYDPCSQRFDHHQRGFSEYYDPQLSQVTKMSSAGMVFKHYGERLLKDVFHVTPQEDIPRCLKQLYLNFIESIDAIDNGVNVTPPGVSPLYLVRSDLSSRVARLNQEWNTWTDDEVTSNEFLQAVAIAIDEFADHVRGLRDSWLPALRLVRDAVQQRMTTDPSGRVIELRNGCPFETHLRDLEEELQLTSGDLTHPPIPNGILFVIYPNTPTGVSWRVKTVKKNIGTFENRLSLPERFRGLREETLQADHGLSGVLFVHHAGFLAGVTSRDAALQLVRLTLREAGL